MPATLEIEAITDQHAFNRRRWKEIASDPALARIEGRIEMDRHGHILMTPPPGFYHADRQADVLAELRRLLPTGGKARPEVPVSTAAGIRAADVAWISDLRLKGALADDLLMVAPEICIEILSPSNTRAEIEEKRALYFDAGADEVWICDLEGRLFFFLKAAPGEAAARSALCPDFPAAV
ncbi:MAG: Uma2 family endonuclease [Verrucomicrobiales bacterium]